MLVQAFSVLAGAPFVVLCGQTRSVAVLVAALTAWGFFKGMHDANIFAAMFDVIPEGARGSSVGWMNMLGWLGGGVTAPVVIAYVPSFTRLCPPLPFTPFPHFYPVPFFFTAS